MRKNNMKHPMVEERSTYGLTGRRFNSFQDTLQIPVFVSVDDEEYFFEVEDV